MLNDSLKGKNALICGSTQGIGAATALQLANLGARTILLARNEKKLLAIKNQCSDVNSEKHEVLIADFSDPKNLKETVSEYISAGNHVDILVNNTGGPPAGLLIEADYDEIVLAMTQHLECSHLLTQLAVPGMKDQKFGRIVNIISTSVKIPLNGLGVSNTVRGAMGNWSKTLANELGPFGITVNNVLPGFTKTSRLESIITSKAMKNNISEKTVIDQMLAEVPARRFASPEEVAYAVAFLVSPMAGYINGINIPVDGGRTGCL